jgi:hypothetical protein
MVRTKSGKENGCASVIQVNAARDGIRRVLAVLEGKATDCGSERRRVTDGKDGVMVSAVKDSLSGALLAGQRDGLGIDDKVFVVGPRGDEDGIAGGCAVDGGLDGWLVGRHMDGSCVRSDGCDQ